ncbi:hypothetical protein LOD99_6937 [Oopsacas minuta]|uniref:PID domain-containing protein n=1 Tax=Oopsacas minuta TaxID=111878 RepID=A0AAV7JJK8_9METZ|nr:hypothetical protein LOD99_6937 [Oopsacas minuta]
MSIRKFLVDLTSSKPRNTDYSVIHSSIPITTTPEKSTREKIVELFNQYSQYESVYDARYIGSHKIHDPRDTQLVHLAIDLVRDGKRSLGGKKRQVELRMKLGNGISVFDDGGSALKLRFPVYKLVYASKAPDNKKVFVFICNVSSEEKKCYRLYAFKSDEKTADRVITTLKEMYFVVHKIHRAKKRKKRELERRKAETQPPEIQMPESQSEQQRPLSAYLSEHALDEHQVIFPTTFGASATHVTAELDSMIEELSMETKSLETATPQAPLNPFVTPEMSSFNFDDNFHEIMPFSEETKANNRVSFYDSFSYNSVDIVPSVEPTDSGATPTIDDEFISIAKRNVAGGSNSGSRSNSFTKLFQKERTSSYTKLESIFAPLSPEQTGTKELTVANPFSELTSPKEKIPTPNTS